MEENTYFSFKKKPEKGIYCESDKSRVCTSTTSIMDGNKKDSLLDICKYQIIPKSNFAVSLNKEQIGKRLGAEVFTEVGNTVVINLSDKKNIDLIDQKNGFKKYRHTDYYKEYSLLKDNNSHLNHEQLKNVALFVRNHVTAEYGSTPSILIIDKTGRYGHLPMILPGEDLQAGIGSDLSEKSYLEWYMGLEAVFKVLNEKFPEAYGKVVSFMQLSGLGGGTISKLHAHLIEIFSQVPTKELELFGIDPKLLDRVKHKQLDYSEVKKGYHEIIYNNFLKLSTNAVIPGNLEHNYTIFYDKIKKIENSLLSDQDKGKNEEKINFDDFISNLISTEEDKSSLLDKFYKYINKFSYDNNKVLIEDRINQFAGFIINSKSKIEGHKNIVDLKLSRVQHIFSSGIIKKISKELEAKVPDLLEYTNLGSDEKIKIEVTDFFDSYGSSPKIKIKSSFSIMGQKGQKVEAFIDKLQNTYWKDIYKLSELILSTDNEKLKNIKRQELKSLLGFEGVLYDMGKAGVKFQKTPESITLIGKNNNRLTNDVGLVSNNYLDFYLDCFKHAGKNPVMQHDGLMPRVIVTVPSDNKDNFEINISPSIVYLPIMSLKLFEKLIGPFNFFKEKNARLELIGEGKNKTVVQKMGGEGFHTFKKENEDLWYSLILIREKEHSLYDPLGKTEEAAVEIILKHFLGEVSNSKYIKNKEKRYLEYYLESYIKENMPELDISFISNFIFKLSIDSLNLENQGLVKSHIINTIGKFKENEINSDIKDEITDIVYTANYDRLRNSDSNKDKTPSPEKILKVALEIHEKLNDVLVGKSENINFSERDLYSLIQIFIDRLSSREQNNENILRDNSLTLSILGFSKILLNEYFGKTINNYEKSIYDNYEGEELEEELKILENDKSYYVSDISRLIYKFITKGGYKNKKIEEFKNYLNTGNEEYLNKILSVIHEGFGGQGNQDDSMLKRRIEKAKQKGKDISNKSTIDCLLQPKYILANKLKGVNYFIEGMDIKINNATKFVSESIHRSI